MSTVDLDWRLKLGARRSDMAHHALQWRSETGEEHGVRRRLRVESHVISPALKYHPCSCCGRAMRSSVVTTFPGLDSKHRLILLV